MTGKLAIEIASLAVAALLATAGCSIPLKDEQLSLQNVCSSDSDCPDGSLCTATGDVTLCVTESVDLPEITFEVRPALGGGASQPSLIGPIDLSSSSSSGARLLDLDLSVPPYVDVSPGRVYLPCAAPAVVPAKVTFLPVPGLSGLLADQVYEADSMLDESGGAFAVSVPPGTYDIHIEPKPDLAVTPDCAGSPPIYIPRQAISKDTGFAIHAGAPITLSGTLKLSQKEDFTKWFLEVIEPSGGRTISEVVQPKQDGIALEVPFSVRFDWTAKDAAESFIPVIRLRPPSDSGKPIIHWSLDGVPILSQEPQALTVTLDVSGVDTQARPVSGQVFHDSEAVAATVILHSKNIPGSDLNRFETTVETDAAGRFEALLPRGEYLVIARPHSEAFAIGFTPWDIRKGAGCFCGNSVDVPLATTLAGSVTTPEGQPTDADVRLTPTAAEVEAFLGNSSVSEVPPRPASATTVDGQFKAIVDAGTFDLSVVPPPDAGYPWLVRPRQEVPVPATSAAPVLSLQPFMLQPPAVLRGTARGPSGAALAGATIRAWVGVDDPKSAGTVPSAVQIASTVSSEDGSYVLLLPPSIKQGN